METHIDPENEVSELQNFCKPRAGTINYREGHFKDNAQIRLEQNNDPVLRHLRARIEEEPFDETEFTQDYRYKHYLQNISRMEIRQDVFFRKYYNDTGMISNSLTQTTRRRIPTCSPWTYRKSPRNHKDDPRSKTKILLAMHCKIHPNWGHKMIGSQNVKCVSKTNESIMISSKLNYSDALNGT